MKNKKNIAVVGAGIFGCTIALILSKRFNVDLYERKPKILNEASQCNQFRFHEGFHYPRSSKTLKEIKKSNNDFVDFYGRNVFGDTENYYGISRIKSKTNLKNYLAFLKRNQLQFKLEGRNKITSDLISGVVKSNEKNLNYFKLKKKLEKKIFNSKVNIKLSSQLDKNILKYKKYHQIIISAYKNNNDILNNIGIKVTNKFRYELIEKIIIKLPKKYKKISFVVMDGDFLCLDPYLGTDYHLISHVKHSKLKVIKSHFSKFNKRYDQKLIKTIFKDKKFSKFKKFIKDGSKYLPFLKNAKYISSFLVVRTLKANVEKTAERTNLIQRVDKNIITVLAGKWNTCVTVGNKIDKMIL